MRDSDDTPTLTAFESGYDVALEEVLTYILNNVERTAEIDTIVQYLESELGWDGDDEDVDVTLD